LFFFPSVHIHPSIHPSIHPLRPPRKRYGAKRKKCHAQKSWVSSTLKTPGVFPDLGSHDNSNNNNNSNDKMSLIMYDYDYVQGEAWWSVAVVVVVVVKRSVGRCGLRFQAICVFLSSA
jgi:hypothetical protein